MVLILIVAGRISNKHKMVLKKGEKISVTRAVREKQNRFIKELINQNYHITNTCKKLGIPNSNYYKWKAKDKNFVAVLEKLRDQEVDVIEDSFRDLIKERNPQAVIFGLKTRGKDRGYVERSEVQHFGSDGIKIEFSEPSNKKIIDAKVVEESEEKEDE